MASISRLKVSSGPAILSYGFRPFFLAGALYGGLGIAIWLPLFFGDIAIPTAFSPLDWHIHEMLYGYLPAVISGFLLTAIPSWTGRPPLRGAILAALLTVWLAGRMAVFVSAGIGPLAAGVIDVSFLLLMAAVAAREVIAARNWRNLAPIGIVAIFFAGNLLFHIEDHTRGTAEFATRLGVAAAVALISLIGGRIVPAFTRNWLSRQKPGRLPVPSGRFDLAVLGTSAVALAIWVFVPEWHGTAVLMILAAILHSVRLGRWAGERTWRDRLVLVLHIAYAFVPIGFLLIAGAILAPQTIPLSGGIHAWTVGAIGTMTLAVMTRASLGHTGQPLSADWLTQAIYAVVILAAAARIAASFVTASGPSLLHLAGTLWVIGFWAFAVGYGPSLLRPRATARA